jgi:integral membrane protein
MKILRTSIGRLRIIGFLEGLSLIFLVFIAVPLKYGFNYPQLTSYLGSVHGALFLLFVLSTLHVGVEENWKFRKVTWKVLIACMIPFGTFYIDAKILKPIYCNRA